MGVGFCWWFFVVDKIVEMWIENGLFWGVYFAVSVKKDYPFKRAVKQGKSSVLSTPTM